MTNDYSNGSPMKYFMDICAIPHASGDEEGVAKYIQAFAKRESLVCRRDASGSVLVEKPAQYSGGAPLILQAHMDMVYVKDPECAHTYGEPLEVVTADGRISANGTSLGADDGAGMAMALSVLASRSCVHPKLYVLFTANEENGMTGAQQLDKAFLPADRMINLDGEKFGVITSGAAGTLGIAARLPTGRKCGEPAGQHGAYTLAVRGLAGGHSGMDISNGSANGIKVLQELVCKLDGAVRLDVCKISGGEKRNAIPASASACILSDKKSEAELFAAFEAVANGLREKWRCTDPAMVLTISPTAEYTAAMSRECADALLKTLGSLPNGVLEAGDSGEPVTSCNIGVLKDEANEIYIEISVRSALRQALTALYENIDSIIKAAGGECRLITSCPAWEYSKSSPLRELCADVYGRMYKKTAQTEVIHGALECGCFKEQCPGLDVVSVGPNVFGAHTTEECITANDMEEFEKYLLAVLKRA